MYRGKGGREREREEERKGGKEGKRKEGREEREGGREGGRDGGDIILISTLTLSLLDSRAHNNGD